MTPTCLSCRKSSSVLTRYLRISFGFLKSLARLGRKRAANSNSVRAISQFEKWFLSAWKINDLISIEAAHFCISLKLRARASSVPSGSLKTKSPNPKLRFMNEPSSLRSVGDFLFRNAALHSSALSALASSDDCSRTGRSLISPLNIFASWIPADSSILPFLQNCMSDMIPSKYFLYLLNNIRASS